MMAHKKQVKKYIDATIITLIVIFLGVFFLFRHSNLFRKRYIFIDGGAHIGESIKNFEQSSLYSEHPWEIFSFEANPYLIKYLPQKPNLTVLNKAIWIHDEGVKFYLAKFSESSSILKHKKTGELSKVPIKVDSVDFGQWLKRNFKLKDFIIVKLDIEGAEYEVLNKMLLDGTIRYVDEFHIEFHNTKVDIPEQRDYELTKQIEVLGISVFAPLSERDGHWFE